jgi:hypothetical protein
MDLIKQTVLTPEAMKCMGKGLPLFLFTAFNSQRNNMLKTSYEELEKVLGKPQSTTKKWRDELVKNKVLEAIAGKGSFILKLVSPYDAIATCELDDAAQIRRIGDPSTRRMLDDMSSVDMLAVVASLGKIADKVQNLEKVIVRKNEQGN